jgi:ribonucleoside-diphosphate reductase alpha chain
MKTWDEMIGYLKNRINPCSTVRVFNACTEAIKQGSTRRGANMGVLRVDHPDVMNFVSLKEVEGELTNFNLSLAITDVFMSAVEKNVDWELKDADGQTAAAMPEIEKMHKGNRKIGLGVMGWADMLITQRLPYGSDEAVALAEKVMAFINEHAVAASRELAEELDVFPNWERSTWGDKGTRIRNATLTTIAPTGSISIIADCPGGIEPNFGWETTRHHADEEFTVLHPLYHSWREDYHGPPPGYFVTAHDVSVEWHVRMQAAFQKHVHNAVSKTINLPGNATRRDVADAYGLAWRLGCKGITVYRDGSLKKQVFQVAPGVQSKRSSKAEAKIPEIEPVKLPQVREQKLVEIPTPEGAIFVHITLADGRPMEVFITTPVESKHDESYAVSARLLSTGLRCGIPVKRLLKQLEEANRKYGSVVSPNGAIIRAFRMLNLNGGDESCPDCGGALVLQEGCMKCISCGFSRC